MNSKASDVSEGLRETIRGEIWSRTGCSDSSAENAADAVLDVVLATLSPPLPSRPETFQQGVDAWLIACFGEVIARDRIERNHRFLEEALELVQAAGCTVSEAHQLVDYTFSRPVGEIGQEVGGVMNTLAALCLAHDLDMAAEGDREMARVWTKVEAIREKQRNKPKHSPLPQHVVATPLPSLEVERLVDETFAKLRLSVLGEGYLHEGEAKYTLRTAIATLSPPLPSLEVERLREALRVMVYETTHLSPCEVDGSHRCTISSEALKQARAALSALPLDGGL